ncbi:unnamed protein product [Ascophyllum nodosum]
MNLLRYLLATALLLYPNSSSFAVAGFMRRLTDTCSSDDDCYGSKVCEYSSSSSWRGRGKCGE